jgi:hypothetical protein
MPDLTGLPGADRVLGGLRDLKMGITSTNAFLVAVAAGRLRDLGLAVPLDVPKEPDLALYESLRDHPSGDPYYRYNALRQELSSFISCLESRRRYQGDGVGVAPAAPAAST